CKMDVSSLCSFPQAPCPRLLRSLGAFNNAALVIAVCCHDSDDVVHAGTDIYTVERHQMVLARIMVERNARPEPSTTLRRSIEPAPAAMDGVHALRLCLGDPDVSGIPTTVPADKERRLDLNIVFIVFAVGNVVLTAANLAKHRTRALVLTASR